MTLKHIRLELARNAEYPNGDPSHGYDFIAPLADDGHLDLDGWRKHRDRCSVRRFQPGEDDEHGHLIHRGRGWMFSYDDDDTDDDEPIFKFDRHRFVQGEYVSITEHDGELKTFRVARVY